MSGSFKAASCLSGLILDVDSSPGNCIVRYDCCVTRTNLDLEQLEAFVAVAKSGSFRAAADVIHLSAPALSRRIERLEEALGARLFHRTTRMVSLTPVGEAFLVRASAALADLEGAVLEVHGAIARHPGRVTVACVPSVALRLVPVALIRLYKQMPAIGVRVIDESMPIVVQSVVDGIADFGVGFLQAPDARLTFQPLRRDRYVLAVHADDPWSRRRRVRLDELGARRTIVLSRTSGNRLLLEKAMTAHQRSTAFPFEVGHVSTLLGMVESGLGVGIVPAMAVPARHPLLRQVALEGFVADRQIGILTLAGRRLKPVAQRLVRHLQELASAGAQAPI